MKKLLSLSLLCLGIMGGAWAQTCGTTITTYPYIENFDGATAPGWFSGGPNSSWALGTPAKTVINSAASGTKSWVTNLTGNYNASEQSVVEGPCFNFSTLLQPVVEMKIWWNSEFSYDGAVLQSSIDGGLTWQIVGAKGDPNNWYNDNTINSAPGGQSPTSAQGWTGRNSSSNGSGGWVTARHVLTGLGGQANVKLRIAFGSDNIVHDEGFAFDNFTIYDTPANDAGVASITSPASPVVPMSNQPVAVTVKNYGTSPLTSATLGFSVNNVVQPTFAWTGNLAMNATSTPVTIGNFAFPAGVHTVKAWSKTPNGAADGIPANDTTSITIYSCNSLSGNYTINKGAAVTTTNFTSFATAAQALANCGVSGPVTFTVAPGSGPYNEKISLVNITGASAANTITFNGNGNTVFGNIGAATDGAVKLDGAKFFRFNNLKIETPTAAAGGSGVLLLNNSTNNIFSGCTVTLNTGSTSSTLYGINVGTGSSSNTFQNNTINGGYYGVYNTGTSTVPLASNQFTGNTLKDQRLYGFSIAHSTNTLVENNDISRPARVNGTDLYGVFLNPGTTGAIISKNRVHNTHDAASSTTGTVYGVYNNAAATAGNENIIKNNLFYNLNNAGGTVYGFYNFSGGGSYYYHNTVASDPAITYFSLRGMHFGNAVTNVKFINNIISFPSTATSNKYAIYLGNTSTSLVSNNNNLYVGTTGNIGYYSSDKATLADWQAANSNIYDQNSLSAYPQFVSPSYLLPISTVINNTGQPLPAVTDDISGAARSTTTPDMGAYEFTPAANDAGIVAIVSPTSPVMPGVSQAVQVTLRNFGTAALTTATIGWSVNNVAQPNYSWTGSLTNLQASAPLLIGNYTFPVGNFTIKVWSKNPNGATDPLAENDTTILRINSCAPLAGNYTINKNNPTAGTNFQSIADATQRLSMCGVSAPVTLTVVSGTGPYNEQVEVLSIPYTSATNTVTFEGNGNTITTMPGAKPGIIVLNGARYVKVNNFAITLDPAATTGWGVQLINAANYNTISNNTINLPLASTNFNINGIVAGSASGATGNNTSNTKIQNNIINGGYYGIQINGNPGGLNADSNQIVGNQVKDPYYYGISVNNANGTLVENNDISRPARVNGNNLTGITLTGTCLNSVVSKNRIHNSHDVASFTAGTVYGIQIGAAATPGNENIVKNNAIYNLNNTNGVAYGLYNSANGTYFYNNTVASDPAITYAQLRGMYFGSAATNVKFINNIISLPSTTTGNKHAIYLQNMGIALTSNNNDLYIGNSGNIGYYSVDHQTLAFWKMANSNAYDQNSVSADPLFVNPATGNLKPSAAAADNLGQALAAVTDDILGAARNATPDFGAYEFGIAANDVGITAVSGPSLTGCGLTATETITVTIKNHGANTQAAVPVTFMVNGVPMAATPETYNAAPLAPNTSATYTFNAKANLAASGTYEIVAKTQLAGDLATSNDADTLIVTNYQLPGMTMTFDFETPATGLSRFRKVVNPKSNIMESAAASHGGTSTKGMIMDGIDSPGWVVPTGVTAPWITNPDNFSAAYVCLGPTNIGPDSLKLTFHLKQLFKGSHTSTNFRVTVNGAQVGPTYNPPFGGYGTNPAPWNTITVDLTPFKNQGSMQIGLESSVKEAFANGAGTANLFDNIEIIRIAVQPQTGVKDNALQTSISVYPNPSAGVFNLQVPASIRNFSVEVMDLTGKLVKQQIVSNNSGSEQLNLNGAAKGIYILKIASEGNVATRKLIVE